MLLLGPPRCVRAGRRSSAAWHARPLSPRAGDRPAGPPGGVPARPARVRCDPLGPAASGLPVARPAARRLRHRGVALLARVPRRHATACGRSSTASASSTARAASTRRSPGEIREALDRLPDTGVTRGDPHRLPLRYLLVHLDLFRGAGGARGLGAARQAPPQGLEVAGRFGDSVALGLTPEPEASRRWERTFSTDLVARRPARPCGSRARARGSGDPAARGRRLQRAPSGPGRSRR